MAAVILALITVAGLTELGLWLVGLGALAASGTTAPAPGGGASAGGNAQARGILCLGDSWTYGAESGDPLLYGYPAMLQGMLDRGAAGARFSVSRLAVPGWTAQKAHAQLIKEPNKNRPAIAVVLLGGGAGSGGVGAGTGIHRPGPPRRTAPPLHRAAGPKTPVGRGEEPLRTAQTPEKDYLAQAASRSSAQMTLAATTGASPHCSSGHAPPMPPVT